MGVIGSMMEGIGHIVFTEQGTEELYDHQTDPMEWNNLAHEDEYATVKARLKALIPTQREPVAPQG